MAAIVSYVIKVNPMTYQNENFHVHKTIKVIVELVESKFLYELPLILVKNSVDENNS